MKTLIVTLLFIAQVAFADDKKFIDAMTQQIESIGKAKTSEEYYAAINAFERIANAEKTKWEPFYYSSFGYLMLANMEKELAKKDQLLDLAAASIAKAKGINENESEVIALEGFIQMIRISVDPASRGAQFSGMAMQSFSKAVALNPENPRALALMAQMQLGTARFFNAPTTEACATANKALEKFATYQSPNPLAPKWGKGMTESVVAGCKQN